MLAYPPTAERSICYVQLAGRYFALESSYLRRIVPVNMLTPIARSSEDLLGLFSQQGDILPLFDLRPLLGLDTNSPAHTHLAALVEHRNQNLGFAIGAVLDVVKLDFGLLKAVSTNSPKALRRASLGQTEYHGEPAIILDIPPLVERLSERLGGV